jgi:hypothetical protein
MIALSCKRNTKERRKEMLSRRRSCRAGKEELIETDVLG